MARTRKQIETLISKKKDQMRTLKGDIQELQREALLLCDKDQWFIEKMEDVKTKVDGKSYTQKKTIGYVHWNEGFMDEDTGKVVTVERSQVVIVDGVWQH